MVALEITATSFVLIGLVALFAGLVNGTTGFGFAVVSTTTVAILFDARLAIVVMIIPGLVSSVPLVQETKQQGLWHCIRRFRLFIGVATVGTLVGIGLLRRVPTQGLTLVLGVITLAYVLVVQETIDIPVSEITESLGHSDDHRSIEQLGVGLFGGLVFGASNVGIPIVAYLDSLDLDRTVFVGMVASIFLGVSSVRVAAAWTLGLYGPGAVLWLSVAVAIPGVVGVVIGERVRHMLPSRAIEFGVHILLFVIGVRLLVAGLGII